MGGQATPPQSERSSSISAGEDFTCALRKDGTPVCWGKEHPYREPDQRRLATVGDETFTSIATGTDHACALREDGAISCWGDNSVGQATPPPGLYVAVTARDQSGCAITVDGELTCWGVSRVGPELSPEGRRYVSITSSESYTCALKENGLADCWGGDGYWTVPQEEFISIRSAGNYACGLREDGTVRCWGYEPYERLFPRDARFASLSTGAHDCGIAEDGAVLCWDPERQDRRKGFTWGLWGSGVDACRNNELYGRASPQEGERFLEVTGGRSHTCALREDGVAVCWGLNIETNRGRWYGQASPPEGELFKSISAGPHSTCGLRLDGTAVCWGKGHHTPEPERIEYKDVLDESFVSVDTGWEYSCGLRVDGTSVCWGDWEPEGSWGDHGRECPPKASGLWPSAQVRRIRAGCGRRTVLRSAGVRTLTRALSRRGRRH